MLVTVNGHAITQADLDFAYLSRGIAGGTRPAQKQVLNSLVDQQLIQDFLAQQKITVPTQQLDESVLKVQKLIRKKGDDPKQVLTKMGLTPEKTAFCNRTSSFMEHLRKKRNHTSQNSGILRTASRKTRRYTR